MRTTYITMSYINNMPIFRYLEEKTNVKQTSIFDNTRESLNINRLYITTHISVFGPGTHNILNYSAYKHNIKWISHELYRSAYTNEYLMRRDEFLQYVAKIYEKMQQT